MRREVILNKALKAVVNGNEKTHGNPSDGMAHVAAMWNSYLGKKLSSPITALDVPHMMVQLKQIRAVNGDATHDDHYVDQAGYAAIAGEIALQNILAANSADDEILDVLETQSKHSLTDGVEEENKAVSEAATNPFTWWRVTEEEKRALPIGALIKFNEDSLPWELVNKNSDDTGEFKSPDGRTNTHRFADIWKVLRS